MLLIRNSFHGNFLSLSSLTLACFTIYHSGIYNFMLTLKTEKLFVRESPKSFKELFVFQLLFFHKSKTQTINELWNSCLHSCCLSTKDIAVLYAGLYTPVQIFWFVDLFFVLLWKIDAQKFMNIGSSSLRKNTLSCF